MITLQTTFGEIEEKSSIGNAVPYFVHRLQGRRFTPEQKVGGIAHENSPWSSEELLYSLVRLEAIADAGTKVLYDVYTAEEIAADETKAVVKLIHYPAGIEEADRRPIIILCSGGGYGGVCNLWEAFPCAARFNELGYHVVCLNYRVGLPGLLPKPMDDLAAAIRMMMANPGIFHFDAARYVVGGYSAGGHLAGTWGTEKAGYPVYGLPAPVALILVYAFGEFRKAAEHAKESGMSRMMCEMMLGKDYTDDDIDRYDVVNNVTDRYPASYLVHAADDSTVPVTGSNYMCTQLEKHGIRFLFEKAPFGEHGFGLGEISGAKGWPERFVKFLDEVEK